ncbi:MAG TPA: cryptochrome/photolyase family protein [bacterium]|nr:cryptochrome/photolyase family protein [bacterium]
MEAALIFPHQLHDRHPAVMAGRRAFLVEDPLFFGDRNYPLSFHKKKLVLHRASMKRYAAEVLEKRGAPCDYIEYHQIRGPGDLFRHLEKTGVRRVHIAEPTDFLLEKRIRTFSEKTGLQVVWHATPNFLTDLKTADAFFGKTRAYMMAKFYIFQRKRLGVLMDIGGGPVGGRWSFDAENPKRIPRDLAVPSPKRFGDNPYVREASAYVGERFPGNLGSTDGFVYPTSSDEARAAFEDFLERRLEKFGPYEDSISEKEGTLFHSLLSPALNAGLVNPDEILQRTLAFAREADTPLASLEGFIRQIIGWREFIRVVYVREGVQQRTSNFLENDRALTSAWYDGTLGVDPVDRVIRRVAETGYAHHIERLMVLGNAMLLSDVHPDEAYRWFMEMFVDAYDWIMVPNLYGMSQYADGGLMTTKPYFAGANYLLKMSDFHKGPWCETLTALYWRFVARHRDLLSRNPRLGVMVKTLLKMSPSERQRRVTEAEAFIGRTTGSR